MYCQVDYYLKLTPFQNMSSGYELDFHPVFLISGIAVIITKRYQLIVMLVTVVYIIMLV